MSNKLKKVFVGMSGGVDSSVVAALLCMRKPKQSSMRKAHANYEVIGCYIKGFNLDGCAEQDAEDARRAAEVLGIPFYVFDFEKEYKDKVVEYMIDGYRNGITPNPDVMCNKEIKFGLFLKKALEMGADYVATGHYVRLRRRATSDKRQATSKKSLFTLHSSLFAARDAQKDQSYFLWTLTQEQLKHCLFPIGEYTKPEVRKLAKKFGLPNAEKKDSQGICFLGQVTLKDFLGNYLPQKRGLVLNTSGKVVGEHSGAYFYTIGQRHLGVRCQVSSVKGDTKPVYIAEKDVKENAILVAEENDPVLYQNEIELKNINFINNYSITQLLNDSITVYARVRYRQPLAKAVLVKSEKRKAIRLIFDQPQKFVASGQSAVFYSKGGEMFGGGIIV